MTGGEGRLDLKSGVAATVVEVKVVVIVVYCTIVEVVQVEEEVVVIVVYCIIVEVVDLKI